MNPEVQLIFDFMLLTPGQRTAFAIRCAMAIYQEEGFTRWANGWLSGSDRSGEAAQAAWTAAGAAVGNTARAATWVTWAARAAAQAAEVADWADAGTVAYGWGWAADTNWSINEAIKINPDLNLTAIAEEVMATHKEEEENEPGSATDF